MLFRHSICYFTKKRERRKNFVNNSFHLWKKNDNAKKQRNKRKSMIIKLGNEIKINLHYYWLKIEKTTMMMMIKFSKIASKLKFVFFFNRNEYIFFFFIQFKSNIEDRLIEFPQQSSSNHRPNNNNNYSMLNRITDILIFKSIFVLALWFNFHVYIHNNNRQKCQPLFDWYMSMIFAKRNIRKKWMFRFVSLKQLRKE